MEHKRLGGYEIIDEIGRGGMAVVYRAWQPSLERYVALKVLPTYFGHDPVFLARFQREARTAASFSHPNIVYVFDVGEQDGVHFIAMEYLAGGSLGRRLSGPTLGGDETRGIIEQVASALDYAHARGLIHRDIKPGNILFTADGRPKVADFGIAQPSGESRLTQTGMVMGTPEYMAPEQAEGRAVDYRADLYALGVILYQALTGRVPFRRTTPHATIHAVIYEPPTPPREVRPGMPPALEAVILRAMAKCPDQRFQSGVEMAAALRDAMKGRMRPGRVGPPVQRDSSVRRKPLLVWILAGVAVAVTLVLLLLFLLMSGNEPDSTLRPIAATAVAHSTLTTTTATRAAIASPDTPAPEGSDPPATSVPSERRATPAVPSASEQLPSATPLPTTETPIPPTPRPDPHFGRLAFTSNRHGNNEIYVLDLAGGQLARLTQNAADDWLPDWTPDGSRLAFTSNRTGSYDLWTMGAGGGGQTQAVATNAWDDYPRWAPDGRRLAFSTTALTQGIPNSEIHVQRASGTILQRTQSTAEDQWPDWSPNGRITYSEGTKGTCNWDILTMQADGSGKSVWLGGPTCDVQASWSPHGKLVAFIRIVADTNGNGHVDELDAGDLWVARADGSGQRQLTSGVWAVTPTWSPDSLWIAFAQQRDSNGNGRRDQQDASDVMAVLASGGPPGVLVGGPNRDGDPSWTR